MLHDRPAPRQPAGGGGTTGGARAAPRPGGRFAFGRMIDRDEHRIALLPPGPGTRQVVIERPDWLAVAEMLVRKL